MSEKPSHAAHNETHRGLAEVVRSTGGGVVGHHNGDYGGDWNEQTYSGAPGAFEPLRVVYNTEKVFPCQAISRTNPADAALCYSGMDYAGDVCVAPPADSTCSAPADGETTCAEQYCVYVDGSCEVVTQAACDAAIVNAPTFVDDGTSAAACAALGGTFEGPTDWESLCLGLGGGGVCEYNPKPDGERACYRPDDYALVGTVEDGDHPENGDGSFTVCDPETDGPDYDSCWLLCGADEIMTAEDYVTTREILDAGAAEILSSLKVERPMGPLVLAPYSCGEGLPLIPSSPETDLLVWVISRPFDSGLAYASVCQRDQHGRPISAVMGMQAKRGSGPHMNPFATQTVTVIVHELYHAMGFNGGTWDEDSNRMLDENLNPRGTMVQQEFPYSAYGYEQATCTAPAGSDDETKQACADAIELFGDFVFEDLKADCENAGCVYDPGSSAALACAESAGGAPACKLGAPSPKYSIAGLSAPRSLQNARKFFGCPSLESMTIEDEGSPSSRGGHWEFIHFAEAAINSIGGSEGFGAFSASTYGVFEDTGWYLADLDKAMFASYGFGEGCDFAASRSCGALSETPGATAWQDSATRAPGYSLPATITYADGSVTEQWPRYDGSADVQVNEPRSEVACEDSQCANSDFDVDLDDTPALACSFDRKGVGRNHMTCASFS